MAQPRSEACPICNTNSTMTSFIGPDPENSDFDISYDEVKCGRCGPYNIMDTAKNEIQDAFKMETNSRKALAEYDFPTTCDRLKDLCIAVAKRGINQSRTIISHVIRKSRSTGIIRPVHLFNILKNHSLPTPAEMTNNLIMLLGDTQHGPGDEVIINLNIEMIRICGEIGARVRTDQSGDVHYIIRALKQQQILETLLNILALSLTLSGWQKYEELKRSVKDSRKAFVAMEFVDPDNKGKDYFFQTELLEQYLKPAVLKTGYELGNPLSSEPKAGNLHARLEVEIRLSRFVIAEISHHNNGAYWEAGFARGLGKPVIYMFNKEIGGDKPHFDVGSDQIVFWEKDKPEEAAQALKGVIRATLFGEAKVTDD